MILSAVFCFTCPFPSLFFIQMTQQHQYKAIILVGGPSRATRFRPLSLDVPKPLFPVAGLPLVSHHLAALAKVEGLQEVLIVGFFENSVFSSYIETAASQFPHLNIK